MATSSNGKKSVPMQSGTIWIIRDARSLTGHEKAFLFVVESRGIMFSEAETARADMGLSRSTFYDVRKGLERKGLIDVRPRRLKSTLYRVNVDALRALVPVKADPDDGNPFEFDDLRYSEDPAPLSGERTASSGDWTPASESRTIESERDQSALPVSDRLVQMATSEEDLKITDKMTFKKNNTSSPQKNAVSGDPTINETGLNSECISDDVFEVMLQHLSGQDRIAVVSAWTQLTNGSRNKLSDGERSGLVSQIRTLLDSQLKSTNWLSLGAEDQELYGTLSWNRLGPVVQNMVHQGLFEEDQQEYEVLLGYVVVVELELELMTSRP